MVTICLTPEQMNSVRGTLEDIINGTCSCSQLRLKGVSISHDGEGTEFSKNEEVIVSPLFEHIVIGKERKV